MDINTTLFTIYDFVKLILQMTVCLHYAFYTTSLTIAWNKADSFLQQFVRFQVMKPFEN